MCSEKIRQFSHPNHIGEKDTHNQSSKPFLIPKLQNYLADFPHLLYSIDQRLYILETWCGCRYERGRNEKKIKFLLNTATSPFPSNVKRVCYIRSPLSTKSVSRNYRYQQKMTYPPREFRSLPKLALCYHHIHISVVDFYTHSLSQQVRHHISAPSLLFRLVQLMCKYCSHEILLPLQSSKIPDE